MRQPVFEVNLSGWHDPAEIFYSLFQHEPQVVWLDSGCDATSGRSYLGVGSRQVTASLRTDSISVDGHDVSSTIFDFLRSETVPDQARRPAENPAAGPVQHRSGFRLGWVGFLGYALHAHTVPAIGGGPRCASASRYPDAALIFVACAVVFDHENQSVAVIGLDKDAVEALRESLENRHHHAVPEPEASRVDRISQFVQWANTDEEYLSLVSQCQEAIRAGDAYQLCLTTQVVVEGEHDAVSTYLALRRSNPSHHGAFFRVNDVALLSSSPELFLSISASGEIESKPIKGTRPRGTTEAADTAFAAELAASEKEQAENLMIVDLVRNDIGRVSALGSVSVPRLLEVESYAHVHQLVSTVRGQLADGLSGVDAVVSCFPAGSMTGAPKSSAVQILEQLENRDRGVYSGAFGYFGLDGQIELSMVIRSILLDRSGATIGTGGGITALSIASEELAEVKLKAAALLAALGIGGPDPEPTGPFG